MKNALVAVLLLVAACSVSAQDLDKPLLLVATPDLQGPYRHTTVLVVPMDGQHIGFILNRATEVKLATLFPEHAPSRITSYNVCYTKLLRSAQGLF